MLCSSIFCVTTNLTDCGVRLNVYHATWPTTDNKVTMMDLIVKTQLTTEPSKTLTGNSLKLHDAEMQLINSGKQGMRRLAHMRSLDIQEYVPGISVEDADKIGAGYAMLKVLGVNGLLTETTKSEVCRLQNK